MAQQMGASWSVLCDAMLCYAMVRQAHPAYRIAILSIGAREEVIFERVHTFHPHLHSHTCIHTFAPSVHRSSSSASPPARRGRGATCLRTRCEHSQNRTDAPRHFTAHVPWRASWSDGAMCARRDSILIWQPTSATRTVVTQPVPPQQQIGWRRGPSIRTRRVIGAIGLSYV